MTLTDTEIGKCYTVSKIDTQDDMRRRILDLGITAGSKIKKLFISPLGEPAAYYIRGAVIALRPEDSDKISVKESCDDRCL